MKKINWKKNEGRKGGEKGEGKKGILGKKCHISKPTLLGVAFKFELLRFDTPTQPNLAQPISLEKYFNCHANLITCHTWRITVFQCDEQLRCWSPESSGSRSFTNSYWHDQNPQLSKPTYRSTVTITLIKIIPILAPQGRKSK